MTSLIKTSVNYNPGLPHRRNLIYNTGLGPTRLTALISTQKKCPRYKSMFSGRNCLSVGLEPNRIRHAVAGTTDTPTALEHITIFTMNHDHSMHMHDHSGHGGHGGHDMPGMGHECVVDMLWYCIPIILNSSLTHIHIYHTGTQM